MFDKRSQRSVGSDYDGVPGITILAHSSGHCTLDSVLSSKAKLALARKQLVSLLALACSDWHGKQGAIFGNGHWANDTQHTTIRNSYHDHASEMPCNVSPPLLQRYRLGIPNSIQGKWAVGNLLQAPSFSHALWAVGVFGSPVVDFQCSTTGSSACGGTVWWLFWGCLSTVRSTSSEED